MSTRRRWIATIALALGSIALQGAEDHSDQAQPATVALVIEGMT